MHDLAEDVRASRQQAEDLKAATEAMLAEAREEDAAIAEVLLRSSQADNKALRRRNNVLVVLMVLLLVSRLAEWAQSYFVNDPRQQRIESVVTGPISDANGKLDEIVAFLHQVQQSGSSSQQSNSVALQEIERTLALICMSTDPGIAAACGSLPPITAPPTTSRPTTTTTTSTTVVSSPSPLVPSNAAPSCTTLPNDKCRNK